MTLITMQGGAVVMRDGKVGTEQGCCCQQCTCPGACVEGLSIQFDGSTWDPNQQSTATPPVCNTNTLVYSQSWDIYVECEEGASLWVQRIVQMYCENGVWKAYYTTAVPFQYPDYTCYYAWEAILPLGEDCLPIAGAVTGWTRVVPDLMPPGPEPCCSDVVPDIIINRNPFP